MHRDDIIRAVAGTIVLASVALGAWIHPAFFLFTGRMAWAVIRLM